MIAQSGGMGFGFYDRGRPKELGFNLIVTTGNEACLEVLDYADHLIDDAGTDVETAAAWLGHSAKMLLDTYGAPVNTENRRLAETMARRRRPTGQSSSTAQCRHRLASREIQPRHSGHRRPPAFIQMAETPATAMAANTSQARASITGSPPALPLPVDVGRAIDRAPSHYVPAVAQLEADRLDERRHRDPLGRTEPVPPGSCIVGQSDLEVPPVHGRERFRTCPPGGEHHHAGALHQLAARRHPNGLPSGRRTGGAGGQSSPSLSHPSRDDRCFLTARAWRSRR